MKKAFILVGHSNWGKSETLARLTKEDRYKRHIILDDIAPHLTAYVRRCSNDDNPVSLTNFATGLGLRIRQDYLIMTLCPNFRDKVSTEVILKSLSSRYKLYFFILKKKYSGDGEIEGEEIMQLEKYGTYILEQNLESEKRAKAFQNFIRENVTKK